MAYRYTRDARMLQTAQKVTNYYLDRLPPDSLLLWLLWWRRRSSSRA